MELNNIRGVICHKIHPTNQLKFYICAWMLSHLKVVINTKGYTELLNTDLVFLQSNRKTKSDDIENTARAMWFIGGDSPRVIICWRLFWGEPVSFGHSSLCVRVCVCVCVWRSDRDVIIIVIGNGHDHLSSNHGRACLHLIYCKCTLETNESNYSPSSYEVIGG